MTTPLLDGLHPVIHRDRYDRLERVNFSSLKLMARSPAHYRHGLITPPEDTDPKRLGRVVHIAAFEPERFRASVAVWDGPRRAGKDWDAFRERNQGLELLTEKQYETCLAIQQAVRADATAMKYLSSGRGEVSLLWTQSAGSPPMELPSKGRIDFDAKDALVDLKTTKDASPSGFGRQVVGLNYHVQAAWYVDGYARTTGERKPYVVVAVENVPPYVVTVFNVPENVLQLGRDEYAAWLDRLAWCRANSVWPPYRDGETELELPRWAMPDDDVGGLDLEIGGRTHGQGLPLEE